jgi:hypothetical protein
MRLTLAWLPGLLCLLLGGHLAFAAAPPQARKAVTAADVQALAEKIDVQIAQHWAKHNARPAARADDSEFVRRVYLDLAGRIPSVQEARSFLEDKKPNKRARLVETLLSGSRYVGHYTNIYRALLIPEAGNNFQVRLQQGGFEGWLKKRIAKNVGYDQMVRELITAKVNVGDPRLAILGSGPSPVPYYLAKEFKPENLAASTARVFLGISVECAQCHNHPFADWKREQFWSFTAFFAGIGSTRNMDFLLPAPDEEKKHEIAIPGGKVVQAKFLDGTTPKWAADTRARTALADWITSPSNPYFARATVNRTWALLFGFGLVEPVDEMVGGNSTASHPELLDLLAREFVAHDFDLKFLIRSLLATRTYQLTSAISHPSQEIPSMFARMPLRGLTGEQIFDSLAMATGYRDSGGGGDDLFSGLLGGNRSARSEFLTKFALSDRPTEAQTSILHALTLMNGKVMEAATSLEKSETLAAVLDAPVSTGERVEALYLAALARKPEPREIDRTVRFVENAVRRAKDKDSKNQQAAFRNALADVFWALLNSPEFVLNH